MTDSIVSYKSAVEYFFRFTITILCEEEKTYLVGRQMHGMEGNGIKNEG